MLRCQLPQQHDGAFRHQRTARHGIDDIALLRFLQQLCGDGLIELRKVLGAFVPAVKGFIDQPRRIERGHGRMNFRAQDQPCRSLHQLPGFAGDEARTPRAEAHHSQIRHYTASFCCSPCSPAFSSASSSPAMIIRI